MLVPMTYRATKTQMKQPTRLQNSQIQNNVVVSSIVPRKDRFKNKAKEVNENLKDKCEEHNFQLVQHHNINPFRHTNAKSLHLNNYGDKQLTRNFTSFIENG